MGRCKSYKKFVTITLDKDLIKVMDSAIEIFNQQKPEKEPRLTRSQFIQDILIGFMSDVDKEAKSIKKMKGENNNA